MKSEAFVVAHWLLNDDGQNKQVDKTGLIGFCLGCCSLNVNNVHEFKNRNNSSVSNELSAIGKWHD
jgi:hypothetical protein